MAKSKADKAIQAWNSGRKGLDSVASLTRVCARYFRPEYNDLETDPVESEIALPNTSAGIIAHMKMVSGLFSNTVAMGKGQVLSTNPLMREQEAVKRFYAKVAEMADGVMETAFPESYHQSLDDYTLGSVGVLYTEFDEITGEHEITAHNANDCVWFLDKQGKVNKMYRKFEYTADQAVEHFGYGNVSNVIQKAFDEDDNTAFEFIHAMYPRKKRNEKRRDSKNMPYEVIYVEIQKRKKVFESGSHRMRYSVYVQNKRRGMRTGYSSAMHSLPAIRTAVRAIDDWFDGMEFKTRPVMFMDDENSVDNAQQCRPGDVRQARLDNKPFLYGDQGEPAGAQEVAALQMAEIDALHFLDLFQALEQFKEGTKTAYEVSQIIAEKIYLIFPIINSIKGLFADVITIISQDIIQFGLTGEPVPQELLQSDKGQLSFGDKFSVKYISRIDTRISGVETENILFAIQEMVEAENLLMNSTDTQAKVKIEKILCDIAERRHLSVDNLRNSTEYKREKAAIAERRAAMAAANANAQAAANRDIQKAPEEGSEAAA